MEGVKPAASSTSTFSQFLFPCLVLLQLNTEYSSVACSNFQAVIKKKIKNTRFLKLLHATCAFGCLKSLFKLGVIHDKSEELSVRGLIG